MNDFDGQTWVAFSDLSGLKIMYNKNPNDAAQALDKFYNTAYDLQQEDNSINCLVVSDCAIFWIDRESCEDQVETLLDKAKSLHQQMLPEYLVRTTIAYGHFKYQLRLEIPRIRKNMIVGGAYLDAYANNDKIDHGAIVIVKFPDRTNYRDLQVSQGYKKLIKLNCPVKGFYEYFWSLRDKSHIRAFLDKRKEIQNTVFQKLKELYSEQEAN